MPPKVVPINLHKLTPVDEPVGMDHQTVVDTYAVEAYILEELSDAEREALENHVFGCTACAEELQLCVRFVTALQRIFTEEPQGLAPEQSQLLCRRFLPEVLEQWRQRSRGANLAGLRNSELCSDRPLTSTSIDGEIRSGSPSDGATE
ncbi:MAG: hypothetical protein JWQ87_5257 [Candidatus Sulfotelmatobacter sp.]|nr:hypothetical protein [Candidatus Sulfotelmatobacter sp.]